MAKCINCGGELFETSKFCPHCGTPVLEISSNANGAKIKEYESDVNTEASEEGLPDVTTAELTPEEQAAVLEMAAEKVLEDIPFIKKLDDISAETEQSDEQAGSFSEEKEIHKDEAPEKKASEPIEKSVPEKHENVNAPKEEKQPEIPVETVSVAEVPKKKSKSGLIAVIAVLAVAAAGGAVFFMRQQNEPVISVEQTETIAEMTTEITEETVSETASEADTETEISSDAVISSEISSEITEADTDSETSAEVSESETDTDTEISEISESEVSESVGEEIHSADELAEGIVIEPEHSMAMGNGVSAEISLSAEKIDNAILGNGVLFLAEYTSQATAPENITPAAMVIRIGDSSVEVSAASSSEGIVIFEYEAMKAAAEEAGFTADDIDIIAIRSTGVPIDVFKITIFQG
ncbi:MAG: zinc ribbon domain-containing protein [Oscillospiraceae bacterium]|nr:zinc ribbon domain-containing protein [Oscillospiraceae bacterium]